MPEKLKCPLRHDGLADFDCLASDCAWWNEGRQCCAILLIGIAMGDFNNFGIAIDKREE